MATPKDVSNVPLAIWPAAKAGSDVVAKPAMAHAANAVISIPTDIVPYTLFICVRRPSSISPTRPAAVLRIVSNSAIINLQCRMNRMESPFCKKH